MSYATRAQIAAMVPANVLARALDADGNGSEDTGRFDAILAVIEGEVDALLAPSYSVPFTTVPAAVTDAVQKLVCERLYMLNSTEPKENPWTELAAEARNRLAEIGAGRRPLATDSLPVAQAGTDADDMDWDLANQDGL